MVYRRSTTGIWLLVGLVALGVFNVQDAQAKGRITSSSSHVDSTGNGAALLAFDGDLATSWVEGAAGFGRGEWVALKLDRRRDVKTVTIFPGCFVSSSCFDEQAHGEVLFVEWIASNPKEPVRVEIKVPDAYQPVTVPVDAAITSIKVGFLDLYDGSLFSDGHISEIALNLGEANPTFLASMTKYRDQGKGKNKAKAWDQSISEAIELSKEPTTLEKALPLLMDAARLGDPINRAYVKARLPPGYLFTYAPPHIPAVDALGQSRVLSALPAIEQTAARIVDPGTSAQIQHLAKWFRAYESFQKETQKSVPYWGGKGTVQGLFQSMGEAMSLDVDAEGRVFVADVGNNRVQRFTPQGRVDRGTGTGRGIDEVYFGKKVDPFVVGAARGTKPGAFENPIYLQVIEGEEAQLLAVVDASLRVQILSLDLAPLSAWTVPTEGEVLNDIGLRWPLLIQAKEGELTVFVGKSALVYDLKGTLIRRFDLEAEPRSVAVIKRRYLLAFGGDEVISYTLDGYRDKVFFRMPPEDRSEDIDLTSDGKGLVVVHSDGAMAYQLDKKGRLLGAQRTFKNPTYPCRISLGDGVLFVSSKDALHRYELLSF